MEQINRDLSQDTNNNNESQNTPITDKSNSFKFPSKSVILAILIIMAVFAFGFMGKKVFSLSSLFSRFSKKEVTSKDFEISFTILDIKDVIKFYSKEIPFAEYSVIESGGKRKHDKFLYIDRGIVKLGLDFTYISETDLIVDREKKENHN